MLLNMANNSSPDNKGIIGALKDWGKTERDSTPQPEKEEKEKQRERYEREANEARD
jgi:hypothetical protein